ncbi:spore photoproduct lyase family protein, partial [bacterium]
MGETLETDSLPAILDVRTIYLQTAARAFAETDRVLARFPAAEIVEVASHWRIPELHGNVELETEWNRTKRTTLVLGVKSRYAFRPNGRSADYIGPGTANGCAMSCAYCYVARRKGAANPITLFVNVEAAIEATRKFAAGLPPKPPIQTDPEFWTFDIGENSDVSLDATLGDAPRRQIEAFREIPNAKATFATKFVN